MPTATALPPATDVRVSVSVSVSVRVSVSTCSRRSSSALVSEQRDAVVSEWPGSGHTFGRDRVLFFGCVIVCFLFIYLFIHLVLILIVCERRVCWYG